MPEGDTIHRTANRLRPALEGQVLVRFEAPRLVGDRPAEGEVISAVEARGKHLLVHFGGGLTLRTHMRMTGSWHLYRCGERWRKPEHLLRALVEADSGWVAVCFQAPVVATYHRGVGQPPELAELGPDLTAADPDIDEAIARLLTVAPGAAVADLLLDQRIASGIGNVYKSEVLFLHGVDPFTPVSHVDPSRLRQVYVTAHQLLRANLHGPRRVTYRNGLAVYGRGGQPCPRCGTGIRTRRHGPMARSTYWCPSCQRGSCGGPSLVDPPLRD